MIKNVSRLCILVVLTTIANVAQAQTVQTVFDAEGSVSRETALPEAVIAVLKSERRVDACFREKGEESNEAEWFAASEIDLNGDRRMDLIVKAKDACLFGANQAPFWVFQKAADGYRKILSASGLRLEIMPARLNSFRRIKVSKAVRMKPASEIYAFRGGKYQPLR